MNPNYMRIAHVLADFLFVASLFVAFAAPTPDRKRRMAMLTGILAVLAFVTGFGLLDMAGYASPANALRYPLWAYVKMVIWVVLAVFGAAVFRSPGRARTFGAVTILLVLAALTMVYLRPF
jgi:hypothetical protein